MKSMLPGPLRFRSMDLALLRVWETFSAVIERLDVVNHML